MRFILLILVAVAAFAGDDLPPAAKKIIDQRDAAIAKANEQAAKDLEKVLVDLTKKGDLDGALAVRTKIEELRSDPKVDVLGQPIAASVKATAAGFDGTWKLHYTNGAIRTYVIDGESIRFLEEKKSGKLKVTGDKAVVDLKDGQFEVLTLSEFFRSSETFKAKAADYTATGDLVPASGK